MATSIGSAANTADTIAARSTQQTVASPAATQQQQQHAPNKVARFFHKLSNKLKLGNSSNADSREALLRELGFGLDFVAIVEQPPLLVLDAGAVCMQRLARVQTVFVRSKDEVEGVGSVVRIEVTLAARKDVAAQGIFRPNTTAKTFVLARPFEECRKLRKAVQYLVSSKRQWGQQQQQGPEQEQEQRGSMSSTRGSIGSPYHDGSNSSVCPFCESVKRYEAFCWEQPPLLATSVFIAMALFRKIVLTNSLTYFIHLARSPFPLAATSEASAASNQSDDTHDVASTAVASDAAAETQASAADPEQHEQQPQAHQTPTPFCEAQAELAILLHDFFQLQQHLS